MSASAGDSYTHNIYGERTSHYCVRSVVCLIGNTIYGVACDSVTSLFQAMIEHLESCTFMNRFSVHLAWMLLYGQQCIALHGRVAEVHNSFPWRILVKAVAHFFKCQCAISVGTETICTRLGRSMASRVLIFFISVSPVYPLMPRLGSS